MSYEDGKKLKIFTGNANPELARKLPITSVWNWAKPLLANSTTVKSRS